VLIIFSLNTLRVPQEKTSKIGFKREKGKLFYMPREQKRPRVRLFSKAQKREETKRNNQFSLPLNE
jgi:hypothetical protein